MIYALDSNIISYWLRKDKQIIERLNNIIIQEDTVIIPPTTYYEIRRGFKHNASPGKELAFNLMCQSYTIGEMTLAVWEQAADIYGKTRKAGNPIEDTDIIGAAYCIVNGYTLVTNNKKHFADIDDLAFENWFEIIE